jgi:hypothetical protein
MGANGDESSGLKGVYALDWQHDCYLVDVRLEFLRHVPWRVDNGIISILQMAIIISFLQGIIHGEF